MMMSLYYRGPPPSAIKWYHHVLLVWYLSPVYIVCLTQILIRIRVCHHDDVTFFADVLLPQGASTIKMSSCTCGMIYISHVYTRPLTWSSIWIKLIWVRVNAIAHHVPFISSWKCFIRAASPLVIFVILASLQTALVVLWQESHTHTHTHLC